MSSIEEKIATCEVTKYNMTQNIFVAGNKAVAVEESFELRLNGVFYRKVFCSPNDLEDLTIGVLAQASKIRTVDDVTRLEITDSLLKVETQAANSPAPILPQAEVRFVANDLLTCADKLLGELSSTYVKTNGVHSGILFDGREILLFREDIGRHNVFDKIFGAALREKCFLGDKALIFSGRCSAEMVTKLQRMKIPVIVAKSVPTTFSITLAKKFGITLVRRLSADSFCIYANPERIVLK